MSERGGKINRKKIKEKPEGLQEVGSIVDTSIRIIVENSSRDRNNTKIDDERTSKGTGAFNQVVNHGF